MTLSRKDFFRKSFYSLGKTVLAVKDGVQEARASLCWAPAQGEPEGEQDSAGRRGEQEMASGLDHGAGGDVVARVDNGHCMARNCGCFSCIERCEAGAISLVMGEGIRINAALCTGCGDCCRICPLAPQALKLFPRG